MAPSKAPRHILITAATLAVVAFAGAVGAAAGNTTVHFDDLKQKPGGKWRGDGVLQSDTRRCSPSHSLDYESWDFKQCMEGRGWRYSWTERQHSRSAEKTWQQYDDDGVWVTCHAILGGFGSVCSNF
jgi:hypothetical protein